jgi:hypothetical protein
MHYDACKHKAVNAKMLTYWSCYALQHVLTHTTQHVFVQLAKTIPQRVITSWAAFAGGPEQLGSRPSAHLDMATMADSYWIPDQRPSKSDGVSKSTSVACLKT